MTDPAFWAPARARPELWRTLVGLVLIALVWVAVGFALVFAGGWLSRLPPDQVMDTERWTGAALFFLTFLGLHAGLALALPLLHKRGFMSLFGPRARVNIRHLALGTLAMLALAAALSLLVGVEQLVLPRGLAPEIVLLRPVGDWLAGLVPALVLIFMQVAAEELAFRGYLLQQLRARFRSVLVWGLTPALLFGGLHYDPATYGVVNGLAYVLNATTMGLLAVFVTLRTGNLSAAIGLHFGNNASLVLIGVSGELSGLSLYGLTLDPKSGYTTYSLLTQTAGAVALFAIWWRWMNRQRPIANRPAPA